MEDLKEKRFSKLWSLMPKDYRGRLSCGAKSLMQNAKFGGGLVTAESITEAALDEMLSERIKIAQSKAQPAV